MVSVKPLEESWNNSPPVADTVIEQVPMWRSDTRPVFGSIEHFPGVDVLYDKVPSPFVLATNWYVKKVIAREADEPFPEEIVIVCGAP